MTYTDFPNNMFVNQGWQCPVCKTVMSPSMPYCIMCETKPKVTVTDNTQRPNDTSDNKND